MDLLRTPFTIIFFLVPLFILSLFSKSIPAMTGLRNWFETWRSGLNWILFRLPFHPDCVYGEIFGFVPKLPYASR